MSGSMSFGGTDLSAYGLRVLNTSLHELMPAPRMRQAKVSGMSGAWDFDSEYEPRRFTVDVMVQGSSLTDLQSKMDSITAILDVLLGEQALIFDIQTDRYWNAKLTAAPSFAYEGFSAQCQLAFIASKPFAYSTTETESEHTIDATPKTIYEDAGGTADAEPTWTLVADTTLTDVDIIISNGTTGDELTWSGSLDEGETLIVDAATWHVTKEGSASMTGLDSGSFPRLKGGVRNTIEVTGFSGTLTIAYRARYL